MPVIWDTVYRQCDITVMNFTFKNQYYFIGVGQTYDYQWSDDSKKKALHDFINNCFLLSFAF